MNKLSKITTAAILTSAATLLAGIAFAASIRSYLSLPERGGLVDTGRTVTKTQTGTVTYQESQRSQCLFTTVYTVANIAGVWKNTSTGQEFYHYGSYNLNYGTGSGYLIASGNYSPATLPAGNYRIYSKGNGCYYNSSSSTVDYTY